MIGKKFVEGKEADFGLLQHVPSGRNPSMYAFTTRPHSNPIITGDLKVTILGDVEISMSACLSSQSGFPTKEASTMVPFASALAHLSGVTSRVDVPLSGRYSVAP